MQLDLVALTSVIVGIISIISGLVLGVRWLVKHYFDEIKHELKPNSGSSLKDQVTRLETTVKEIKEENAKGDSYHEKLDDKIQNLTNLFIEYVSRQK